MNDFDKFNSFITELPDNICDDYIGTEKYAYIAYRFDLTPSCIGIQDKNFNKFLKFVKSKLPQLSKMLPDEVLNQEILDFVKNSYKNPNIISLEPLIQKFSPEVSYNGNIVLILNNFKITQEIHTGYFSLYYPQHFYNEFIEPEIKLAQTSLEPEDLFFEKLKQNFQQPIKTENTAILILKNILVYKHDDILTKKIITSAVWNWAYFLSVNLKYSADFLPISIRYALDRISIFQDKQPRHTFISKELNIEIHKQPIFITNEDISKIVSSCCFVNSTNSLDRKIFNTMLWLGKSKFSLSIADSFLQIAIACECLLSYDEKSLITPSKTYYFSETASFLISDQPKVRQIIFKELKKFYSKRSEIVHAGESSITEQMKNRFYRYVYKSLTKILELKKEQEDFTTIKHVVDWVNIKKFS